MPNTYKFLLGLVSIFGFSIIVISAHRYGAGLSPDSIEYIASARNIVSKMRYISYDGSYIIVRPPLYSVVLAFVSKLTGKDPLIFSYIVNAIIFGITVFITGCVFFRYFPSSPFWALLGAIVISVSPSLFNVFIMVWSESLFILLMVLSIFFADLYLEKRSLKFLFLLSLSTGLACLTRYIGFSLVLWSAIVILLFNRANLRSRCIHALTFLFVALLPTGIWLIRNYYVSNTFFGARGLSLNTISQELGFAFSNLLYWYIPKDVSNHRSLLMLVSILIGFFLGLSFKDGWQNIRIRLKQVGLISLCVLIYVFILIISTLGVPLEAIGNRYLAPIYIPLTLLLLILLEIFISKYQISQYKILVNTFLVIGFLFWLSYPLHETLLAAVNLNQNGLRYSSKQWRSSETIQYLLKHQILKSYCEIYTNDPFAIYILTQMVTKISPASHPLEFPEIKNNIFALEGFWPKEERACLVWFDLTNRKDLFTFEELKMIANFVTISSFQDGSIYSVIKK